MSQLQMGDNDEAIETFQRSLLLNPRKLISWGGLTGALFAAEREVEAKNALVKWREIAVTDEGASRRAIPMSGLPSMMRSRSLGSITWRHRHARRTAGTVGGDAIPMPIDHLGELFIRCEVKTAREISRGLRN